MTKEQQQKLDATLLNIQKKYGKESISLFGKNQTRVERVPISSMNLTEMMGGGFPRGRMIEIYGPESSGKSTLAEYFGGQCQKYFYEDKHRNGVVAYIDVEHALDPVFAESVGLKMEDVLFSQPDSAEQALDIVNDLLISDVCDLIVVDSVAALVPQAEADGEMGDQQMGLQARLMSKACRKLQANMTSKSASIIWINQIREKIGCVAPDTMINWEQKTTSLETLFKEGFGLDWKQMAIGEAVDVSDKNVFVSSYSHEENKEVQAKVLKAVRKPDAKKCVFYTEGKRVFDGSPDHKVWAKLHLDKDAAYFTAKQLSKKTFYLFNGKDWKASSVEITKEFIPILDVEIENTHNYFSNGVLSHNTMYGNPECVTLDTKVNIHSAKQISMENLFKKAGLDWKSMELNTAYDISDKNFTIESFNHETGQKEFKKILALVYKGESPIYEIKSKNTGTVLLTCSGGHRLWDEEMKRYTHVSELLYGTVLKADGTTEEFVVEKTDRVEPIVDMSVEGNENYFSNEILSHNTTTGGNALKFYASIRFTIRRKENVTGVNSDDIIGIISTLKSIKNKVAPPFKTCEMKLIFGKGYQVEEEYVTAFVKRSLVTKSGSWYSWTYKDLNGKECAGKEQGLDNVTQWFKDNPVVFEQMKKKIQDMVAKESAVVTEKEENEEEVIKQQTKLEKEEFADLHTSETSKPEDLAAQALAATETK